jgi:hypothetical protein
MLKKSTNNWATQVDELDQIPVVYQHKTNIVWSNIAGALQSNKKSKFFIIKWAAFLIILFCCAVLLYNRSIKESTQLTTVNQVLPVNNSQNEVKIIKPSTNQNKENKKIKSVVNNVTPIATSNDSSTFTATYASPIDLNDSTLVNVKSTEVSQSLAVPYTTKPVLKVLHINEIRYEQQIVAENDKVKALFKSTLAYEESTDVDQEYINGLKAAKKRSILSIPLQKKKNN